MPIIRPRRNRKNSAIRNLVQETQISTADLIYPQFVIEGQDKREVIASMPGIYRLSIDKLLKEVEELCTLNIPAIALFPAICPTNKCSHAQEALNPDGLIPRSVRAIKQSFPHLCVIADVALDPYTSHGHDGIISAAGEVLNDATTEILAKMALVLAEAGSDFVAPSDMMDGNVAAVRRALDLEGFDHVGILAYSVKYASCLYSPFRDAVGSHLAMGDKKSYQMDPANQREALREALLDQEQGADIIMVKPALAFLDVICKIREQTSLPISAYQVSGEYAMIMAAVQNGWLDESKAFLESLLCIKRAGADMIFTYAAKKIALLFKNGALDLQSQKEIYPPNSDSLHRATKPPIHKSASV